MKKKQRKRKLELEPFSSEASVFEYLGEIGTRLLNKRITERTADLCLNAVTKYFTAQQLYKSLKEPEKPTEPCATQTELATLRTDFESLKKELQIKVTKDGMFT